jgi:muramoyltetrapeptide carboxypeptidase
LAVGGWQLADKSDYYLISIMRRKEFLSSVLPLGLAIPAMGGIRLPDEDESIKNSVIPPYLKPGDLIGITCPAGFITDKELQPSIDLMKSWGFNIKVGATVGKRDFTFGGTDAERTIDMQLMLDDPKVKAIMCARGGYGAVRIIDRLIWDRMKEHPKWIIGFSDITVLHCHLGSNFGIASIHSKMCNSFPDNWSEAEPVQADSILSIRRALVGEKMKYDFLANERNRVGTTTGALVGGNLKTIETLGGTKSAIQTEGKILFVEDTGEYLYSIDRMFWNLKRAGRLSKIRGLIIGGFKIKPDDPGEEFGRTLADIVFEKVKEYDYPVCFDFPVGHQKNNYALKCGVKHKLVVDQSGCVLSEV